MSNKNFKRPLKIKSSIVQYCVVALVCLPILIWFGINAESRWKLSSVLTIFIMCCIILAVWLCWIGIRTLINKRTKAIRQEKKQNRSKTN